MLFKNKVDINSVQVGQWVKIDGTITIDNITKDHLVVVDKLSILETKNNNWKKPPSIDNEIETENKYLERIDKLWN